MHSDRFVFLSKITSWAEEATTSTATHLPDPQLLGHISNFRNADLNKKTCKQFYEIIFLTLNSMF